MSNALTRLIIVIAAWQASCAMVKVVCGPLIGWAVYSAYTSLFGDVQDSYVAFWRTYMYVERFTVTALATAVGVTLLTVLERRRATLRLTLTTFIAWHAAAVAALVASDEFGLFWLFHQLDWALFGPPDNFYGFRNIVLPRLIAWVVSSTPAIAAVLWLRGKLAPVQPMTQAQSKIDVRPAGERKPLMEVQNPYAAPQTTATGNRTTPGRRDLASLTSSFPLCVAVANACALPLVCLVGLAGMNADISPREQAVWGATALAFASGLVINVVVLTKRSRLTAVGMGIVVAINVLMAAFPLYALVAPGTRVWPEAIGFWSLPALTVAAIVLTAKTRLE